MPSTRLGRSPESRRRLLIQITVPETFGFFKDQLRWLRERGYEVHTVSSDGPTLNSVVEREGIIPHVLPTKRNISVLHDAVSLVRMIGLYIRLRPDIVHAFTPKAGLLSMIAASLTRRPVKVYSILGLVYMSKTGWRRRLLKAFERLSCALANRVYCECDSMKKVIEEDRLCSVSKLRALPAWNYNGLSAMAARRPHRDEYRFTVRQHLSIAATDFVVGFVGRLVPEKGISELLQAHARVVSRFPFSHLLLIGYTEEEQPLPASALEMLKETPNVHQIGFQSDVVPYLASIDVLTLPSYREGLPTAPLEAATLGVPVILSDIPGCVDAATANVTGLFVPARDANALANAMERMLTDPQKRARFGDAARRWADKLIQHTTWESLLQDYGDLSGRPVLSPPVEAH